MKRLLDVLLWSVIAAAFIGPGTVTTAARAGSDFGFALAWALTFSTVACLVLQEAAGRITVLTGRELGEALSDRCRRGRAFAWLPRLLAAGIVLGCAAYQAGNILGAVAGLRLVVDRPPAVLALLVGAAALALLATGRSRRIAQVLGALVAVMGIAFLVTAVRLGPDPEELLTALLLPRMPAGSTVLVLGLVGTTVVPYNLFLGSALARGARLADMRWGLAIAVVGGGLISLGVLVVGSALGGGLEYERLAAVLGERLGAGAELSLAVGLFAAGFTSAITAPLAAALATRALLGAAQDPAWREGSVRFRLVWLGVLLFGLGFGLAGVRPIPVIILAQACNGVLLPFAAAFLWLTMNDRVLLGRQGTNGRAQNLVMAGVVAACVALGAHGLVLASRAVLALL